MLADPGKDQPNGVHLEGPDKARVVVYAVDNQGAVWHCLLTPEQREAVEKAGIAFKNFSTLEEIEKLAGAPRHVFGSAVYEPGDKDGEFKVYRPGKAEPEIIAANVVAAELEAREVER